MAGRPSKYKPELLEKIKTLYGQGKTDEQVAALVGVTTKTLYNWRERFAEFLLAVNEQKQLVDDMVEATLLRRALGYTVPEEHVFCFKGEIITHQGQKHYPPDPFAAMFWLKNRRPDKWREKVVVEDATTKQLQNIANQHVDFATFCTNSGYPAPMPKQLEMRDFAFAESEPRMLLGARGYGKTDYLTILGVAYEVYLDRTTTILIVTKSKSRNTAIIGEIANALKLNGVELEKENSTCVRIKGHVGKDHSVETITIKTSFRGRHPDMAIMDDPVTEEDISEAMRKTVKTKYNELMKLCSNVVVIGQPAHKYDLYAELRPMVKLMEVPHGSIPELDHDLEAQRLAGVDEASISASYFLKVLSESDSPFDKCKTLEVPFGNTDSVAFIDPSFEGGDYTAMSIVRGYMQGVSVVGFVYKKAWNHCIDDMVQKMKRFGVKKLCFETNSLGTMPLDLLRSAVGEHIGVVGRKSNTNKHSRIVAAGTYAHLIHISKESDRVYIDQVVKYEYNAKNDDAPDSLASCLEWIGLIRGKI
jgi:energy-coupling factor transporter ATP-binding protein EcfA2